LAKIKISKCLECERIERRNENLINWRDRGPTSQERQRKGRKFMDNPCGTLRRAAGSRENQARVAMGREHDNKRLRVRNKADFDNRKKELGEGQNGEEEKFEEKFQG